jgi:uncharacterized protein with HEPN domain
MSREWRFYLRDAIDCCDKVIRYTQDVGRAALEADERTYDAVLRNLELLGEAVKYIPDQARKAHPKVPWAKIVGMRDILAHHYFGVDKDAVWDVIANHIEPLGEELKQMERRYDERQK